jgi:hypothetical protein
MLAAPFPQAIAILRSRPRSKVDKYGVKNIDRSYLGGDSVQFNVLSPTGGFIQYHLFITI